MVYQQIFVYEVETYSGVDPVVLVYQVVFDVTRFVFSFCWTGHSAHHYTSLIKHFCGPSWYVQYEKVLFSCSFGLLKGPKRREKKNRTANNCVFTHFDPVSSTLTLSTSLRSLIRGAGLLLRAEQVHQFGSQLAVRNGAEALNTQA